MRATYKPKNITYTTEIKMIMIVFCGSVEHHQTL